MSHRERRCDHPAEREADECRPVDRLGVEQCDEIGDIVVEVVRPRRLARLPVAAQVVTEQRELVAQRTNDAVPGLKVRANPVKQRDMTAASLHLEVDRDAVARCDHRVGAGPALKCGITWRPKSSSDRIATLSFARVRAQCMMSTSGLGAIVYSIVWCSAAHATSTPSSSAAMTISSASEATLSMGHARTPARHVDGDGEPHKPTPFNPSRGFSAMLSPSPSAFKSTTRVKMAAPGNAGTHHAVVALSRPFVSIWPRLTTFGSPTPRKL